MRTRIFGTLMTAAALLMSSEARADYDSETDRNEIHGKVDFGPAYMHIDFERNNVTTNHLDLYGMQGNVSVMVWKGLTIRTQGLYGRNDGMASNLGLGIGWIIPIEIRDCKFYMEPHYDHSWGYIRAMSPAPTEVAMLFPSQMKQGMHNKTHAVGMDLIYGTKNKKWTFTQGVAYGWTRTRNTFDSAEIEAGLASMNPLIAGTAAALKNADGTRVESRGFNFTTMVDYWFNDNWALAAAVAVQTSNGKEKNSSLAYGGRIGPGYYF